MSQRYLESVHCQLQMVEPYAKRCCYIRNRNVCPKLFFQRDFLFPLHTFYTVPRFCEKYEATLTELSGLFSALHQHPILVTAEYIIVMNTAEEDILYPKHEILKFCEIKVIWRKSLSTFALHVYFLVCLGGEAHTTCTNWDKPRCWKALHLIE